MEDLLELEPHEARVLGVLIEKELTTPDQYPLSLNGLTNGCNQKSNREPVMELSNSAVSMLLDKLVIRGLVGRVASAGSRVEHYRHNARERLDCQVPQLALLCELLVRGPQSASQLRKRIERMVQLDAQEVFDSHLSQLQKRGLVKLVPAGMGSRAERYAQTLSPDAHPLDGPAAPAPAAHAPRSGDASALEVRVAKLEAQLARLAAELGVELEAEDSAPAE
ncbi:MAG: DUF480 domain-containing protein [Planctomycetes bacterium]|nr:DUF480 domain-containing protein [Planctomycetota bacterium]